MSCAWVSVAFVSFAPLKVVVVMTAFENTACVRSAPSKVLPGIVVPLKLHPTQEVYRRPFVPTVNPKPGNDRAMPDV